MKISLRPFFSSSSSMALAKASNRNSPRLASATDDDDLLVVDNTTNSSKNKYKNSTIKPCTTDFDENSEYADLAEKIFQNINAAFDRDELIDEFDIIPAESKQNHSPVLHIATEHKLGLEAWCVPYLYTHSYKTFLAIRRKQKSSTSSLLATTNLLPSRYGSLKASNLSESDRISRGLTLSRTLVLLNPDLAVAWNFRRDFVPIISQGVLQSELNLVSLVATRKPKCPEGFAYRRWLINQAFENCVLVPETIGEWFLVEAKSIEIPTLKYFSNYHAWSYRIWLLQKILLEEKIPSEQKHVILESELNYSSSWMNTHVSDYCGHHYRQKLLEILLLMKKKNTSTQNPHFVVDIKIESIPPFSLLLEIESELKKELEENTNRIQMYEGRESLWCHRRAIMKLLLDDYLSSTDNVESNSTSQLIANVQEKEKEFVRSIFKNLKETSMDSTKLNCDHCKKYIMWSNVQYNWQLE